MRSLQRKYYSGKLAKIHIKNLFLSSYFFFGDSILCLKMLWGTCPEVIFSGVRISWEMFP